MVGSPAAMFRHPALPSQPLHPSPPARRGLSKRIACARCGADGSWQRQCRCLPVLLASSQSIGLYDTQSPHDAARKRRVAWHGAACNHGPSLLSRLAAPSDSPACRDPYCDGGPGRQLALLQVASWLTIPVTRRGVREVAARAIPFGYIGL